MRLIFIFLGLLILGGCTTSRSKSTLPKSELQSTEKPQALAFQADRNFGKSLSSSDRRKLSEAEKRVLDFGKPNEKAEWNGNAPSNASGSVAASALFRVGKSNCRQFRHTIKNSSTTETVQGTACKRDDGSWRLVS